MKTNAGLLTYCTNIHPGENWKSHFEQLQTHLPWIKTQISPEERMGIGLRISNQMSIDLMNAELREEFKVWLEANQMYVFIINGFPYGQFHDTVIKDQVHAPDWTSNKRLDYTIRMFDILKDLLPEDLDEGGISTSPLSYRHWHNSTYSTNVAFDAATRSIIQVVEYLDKVRQATGKSMHLDVEIEPDGLIENVGEFIHWYEEILIPMGQKQLGYYGLNPSESEEVIRRHIQLCYDVCHMAVEFEDQSEVTAQLKKLNIAIGRIQLSSALLLPPEVNPDVLRPFDETQYLHQVRLMTPEGDLMKYKDLAPALASHPPKGSEWRVHFHVPLFTERYGQLHSTRSYIDEILQIHRHSPLTNYLEVETYTWNVLPDDLQLPIGESIARELDYVRQNL